MLSHVALRERAISGGVLLTTVGGRFFHADRHFVERRAAGMLSGSDAAFLDRQGLVVEQPGDLTDLSHAYDVAARSTILTELDYLILVPTLRCNLACSYCQVSRADERAHGFDWSDETLAAVTALLRRMTARSVKIEFQGGEPMLRPDLIEAVIAACSHFEQVQFVICTNLSRLDDAALALFDRPNVHISTSLDGSLTSHQSRRTVTDRATRQFASNFDAVLARYGPTKISALPTIDPRDPPPIDELIDAFASRGLAQIFLRPINYQGFARKRHAHSRAIDDQWYDYQRRFVRRLIEINWSNRDRILEETYLTVCLKRIFQPGHARHVDLRNPNPAGVDYVVIDYDGSAYPTDEARMLTRSGVIDLRIGDIASGWDSEARRMLSAEGDNRRDPDCNACAYQAYCGRDVIDDLARYGRIDVPRHETEFCRRHLHMFDLAFELIYDEDPAVQYSLHRWLRLRGDDVPLGARL